MTRGLRYRAQADGIRRAPEAFLLKHSVLLLGVATATAALASSGSLAGSAWVAQTLFFVSLALFLAVTTAGFVRETT